MLMTAVRITADNARRNRFTAKGPTLLPMLAKKNGEMDHMTKAAMERKAHMIKYGKMAKLEFEEENNR